MKKEIGQVSASIDQSDSKATSSLKKYIELRTSHHSDAMLRFKRRKTIFSGHPIQLEVELHNEGILVSYRSVPEKSAILDGESSGSGNEMKRLNKSEFIFWGSKAMKILYSISVGRIPDSFEKTFDPKASFLEGSALMDAIFGKDPNKPQAGTDIDGLLMKALITDYRIPDTWAKKQRAIKFKEIQTERAVSRLEGLRKRHNELLAKVSELQQKQVIINKRENDCVKELKSIKKASNAATLKLQTAWHKRNSSTLDINGAQQLDNTIRKLQMALAKADDLNRLKSEELRKIQNESNSLKMSFKETTQVANKIEVQLRQLGEESMENVVANLMMGGLLSQRIADVLKVVQVTLEERRLSLRKRREIDNNKEKPQRPSQRRLCLILRPSRKKLIDEIYQYITFHKRFYESSKQDVRSSQVKIADMFRAEQRLLQAFHPRQQTKDISFKPSTSKSMSWTEPGVLLNLEVPKSDFDSSNILPTLPSYPIFHEAWSHAASAPGRQTSTCLKPKDVGIIMSTLSDYTVSLAPSDVFEFRKEVNLSGKYEIYLSTFNFTTFLHIDECNLNNR